MITKHSYILYLYLEIFYEYQADFSTVQNPL